MSVVTALLAHDIDLFAFHLPLDAHPEVGNNARLARRPGVEIEGGCEDRNRGVARCGIGHHFIDIPDPV